jgi:hypothetical protein
VSTPGPGFQDSLAAFQARRVDWGVINTLDEPGHLACHERRYRDAAHHFERAIELGRSRPHCRWSPLVMNAIVGLALHDLARRELDYVRLQRGLSSAPHGPELTRMSPLFPCAATSL